MSFVCKKCGSENIRSVEDLTGTCDLSFMARAEDGSIEYDFCGYTEVYWDSSHTTGFECGDCFHGESTLDELVVEEEAYVSPTEKAALLGNLA